MALKWDSKNVVPDFFLGHDLRDEVQVLDGTTDGKAKLAGEYQPPKEVSLSHPSGCDVVIREVL
jgi:hypothetical protein